MVTLYVGKQRGFQGGVDQFVHAKRAEKRIGAHAGDKTALPAQHAGLWTAQQLISAVSDHVDARAQAIQNTGFVVDPNRAQVEERAAAQVFYKRKVALAS